MLISYPGKFIYVHIPKTGGTSIQQALRDYRPWFQKTKYTRYLINTLSPFTGLNILQRYSTTPEKDHSTALEIKDFLPQEMFDNYFKFAFIRNPWSRLVSEYFYIIRKEGHTLHKLVDSMESFNEFVKWKVSDQGNKKLQKDFVTDKDGNVIVDFIGKLENIDEDFELACQKAEISYSKLSAKNSSNHKPYSFYYNQGTKELVRKEYQEDIELFDYKFEEK